MSAKFTNYAIYFLKVPVMICGVARTSRRGARKCIEQQLVVRKEDLISVRGTVKAAKLVGEPSCELVTISIYNSKPL